METAIIFVVIVVVGIMMLCALNGNKSREEEDKERENALAEKNKHAIAKIFERADSLSFIPEKTLDGPDAEFSLAINTQRKQWLLALSTSEIPLIYGFSDLISFGVVDNGAEVMSSNAEDAAIGGFLFGAVGAIAGAATSREILKTCNDLHIDITVNNLNMPHITLPLVKAEIDRSSDKYKERSGIAKEVTSLLAYIKENAGSSPSSDKHLKIESPSQNNSVNIYDELEKLYGLKEKGIITEEEFQKKKESMLGI